VVTEVGSPRQRELQHDAFVIGAMRAQHEGAQGGVDLRLAVLGPAQAHRAAVTGAQGKHTTVLGRLQRSGGDAVGLGEPVGPELADRHEFRPHDDPTRAQRVRQPEHQDGGDRVVPVGIAGHESDRDIGDGTEEDAGHPFGQWYARRGCPGSR